MMPRVPHLTSCFLSGTFLSLLLWLWMVSPAQESLPPQDQPIPHPPASPPQLLSYSLPAPPQINPAQTPEVKPTPSPEQDPFQTVTPFDKVQGRTLLRLLEHGQGPQIELAWPPDPSARDTLFKHLRQCHGMISALLAEDGSLWRLDDPAQQPWALNLDRYSGFLRHVNGQSVRQETDHFIAIRRHHQKSGHSFGQRVRLFPRAMDAALLGGLKTILGPVYETSQTIHARYHVDQGQLRLRALHADDTPYTHQLSLPPTQRCGFS